MLNALWATMIIIGIITGIATGHIEEVSSAFMDSAGEAVALCITMLGVMSMWTGILKIAECSGLLKKMTGWMMPVIRFLFPKIPKEHPAVGYIATNFAANILGLGWAATPAGLKAMEELEKLNSRAPYRASNAINSGEYYCLPKPVWQCSSVKHYRSGDCCHGNQYWGGYFIL